MSAEAKQLSIVPEAQPGLVAMLERLATNPDVPVDKLERLLAMQERIQAKQAETDFDQAMSAAQNEMGRISTDAENKQTHSKYATYGKLDRVIRPIYTQHGFALSFGTAGAPTPGTVRVTCRISHRGGHSREHFIDMPADGKGAKGGDVMTLTHATGAAASYGMRYLLKMIFNVAIGEDDKDGNTPKVDVITEKQAADLSALIDEVQADRPAFMEYIANDKMIAAKSLAEIPAKSFSGLVKMLERKRKGKAK